MGFKTVKLQNFRSHEQNQFEFDPKATIVIGPNGSGKTNLLEALYVLSHTKSFRALDRELIARGQDWYQLTATTAAGDLAVRFEANASRKTLTRKKVEQTAVDYIGRLPVVLFEPRHLDIVHGGPKDRRQFVDKIISTVDRRYLDALLKYRHILKQRNALLKKSRHAAEADKSLFAWDIKLAELADYLVAARQELVDYMATRLSDTYRQIAGDKAEVTMIYRGLKAKGDYATALVKQLADNLPRDRLLGYTSAGPHRDDLEISINGRAAAAQASRGEARTIILALKLLELAYTTSRSEQDPILLLDDVFSELDTRRQQLLADTLNDHQTVITTTDIKKLKLSRAHTIDLTTRV